MTSICGLFFWEGTLFWGNIKGGKAFLHGKQRRWRVFLVNFYSHRGLLNIAKYYSIYNQIKKWSWNYIKTWFILVNQLIWLIFFQSYLAYMLIYQHCQMLQLFTIVDGTNWYQRGGAWTIFYKGFRGLMVIVRGKKLTVKRKRRRIPLSIQTLKNTSKLKKKNTLNFRVSFENAKMNLRELSRNLLMWYDFSYI